MTLVTLLLLTHSLFLFSFIYLRYSSNEFWIDFLADLEEHEASDEIVILVFSEFGRRMKDNGSGTDHGSGGGAFFASGPTLLSMSD